MRTRVDKAKIACIDFNLNKFKMQMGIQVLVTDPKNLEKIRFKECEILKERCEKLIKAGATVILTTKAIDDIA
jgi:T-complex protein 1 subunit alpha